MLAVHGTTGAALSATAALTSLGYSGEHFDARAQQQYLRARWYDPSNGHFSRLDPFAGNMRDPQSLHKYAYVHGDPVNGLDPTWLFTIQGMLSSISIRVNMIQTRISKGLDVATRIYQQLIRISVILNLTYGMMDQSLYPSIVIASLSIRTTERLLSNPASDSEISNASQDFRRWHRSNRILSCI